MIKSIRKFVYLALILAAVLCLAFGVSLSLTTKTVYAEENVAVALTDGEVGFVYNATVKSNTYVEGNSYVLFDSMLFEGLTLSADGKIFGTPLEGGSANFIVKTLDSEGNEVEENIFSLTVKTKEPNAVYTESATQTRKSYKDDGTLREEITEENVNISLFDEYGHVVGNKQIIENTKSGETKSNTQTLIYDANYNILTEIYSQYEDGFIVARNRRDYEYDLDNRIIKSINIHANYYNSFFQGYKTEEISEYDGDTLKNNFTSWTINDEGQFEENESYFEETTTTETDTESLTVNLRYSSAAKTEADLEQKRISVESETENIQEIWQKYSSDQIRYTKSERTILSDTLQKIERINYELETDWNQTEHTIKKTEVTYREILIKENDLYSLQSRYYIDGELINIDYNRMTRTFDKDTVTEISSSYRNDVITSEYVRFYKKGELVINDEATLLNYLKNEDLWIKNSWDNVILKEGVNVTLAENLTIPNEINFTFNNLIIAENAELTIPNDSNIKISGTLVCGATTVGADLDYVGGNTISGTIENPTVRFPAWAIALICVLSAVVLLYLLGLYFYKKKIIKWKFLKYLYGYVKLEKAEDALSQKDVLTTENTATEPEITAENPAQESTPEPPAQEDTDNN